MEVVGESIDPWPDLNQTSSRLLSAGQPVGQQKWKPPQAVEPTTGLEDELS